MSSAARMGKNKKKKGFVEEVSPFTKTDMQRVGLFREVGYITVGDPFRNVNSKYSKLGAECIMVRNRSALYKILSKSISITNHVIEMWSQTIQNTFVKK